MGEGITKNRGRPVQGPCATERLPPPTKALSSVCIYPCTYLYVSIYLSISLSLSIYLPACLSVSVCVFISLIYLPISIHDSSIHQSIRPSIHFSLSLSLCLSLSLSLARTAYFATRQLSRLTPTGFRMQSSSRKASTSTAVHAKVRTKVKSNRALSSVGQFRQCLKL